MLALTLFRCRSGFPRLDPSWGVSVTCPGGGASPRTLVQPLHGPGLRPQRLSGWEWVCSHVGTRDGLQQVLAGQRPELSWKGASVLARRRLPLPYAPRKSWSPTLTWTPRKRPRAHPPWPCLWTPELPCACSPLLGRPDLGATVTLSRSRPQAQPLLVWAALALQPAVGVIELCSGPNFVT